MGPRVPVESVSSCLVASIFEPMPPGLLLEVAVDSLARAEAAERAGAHRLELCTNLEAGGLTPSLELGPDLEVSIHPTNSVKEYTTVLLGIRAKIIF